MIHKPSGKPFKYLKGIETEDGFDEVPEEEIIKGYEHTKGHHVLIKPEELDDLKLEAKHTSGCRNQLTVRLMETRLASTARPGFVGCAMEPDNEKSRDEALAAYERGVMILLFILAFAVLALAVWLVAYLFSV